MLDAILSKSNHSIGIKQAHWPRFASRPVSETLVHLYVCECMYMKGKMY